MDTYDFLSETVCCMGQPSLDSLKKMLIGGFLQFAFVEDDRIDNAILAEKLVDYFSMVAAKTNKPFGDCISSYMEGLNSIVEPRISNTAQGKQKSETNTSRARKYYDRFAKYRSSRDVTVDDLIDYSRIMFCLYEAILENGCNPIDNFDYSIDSIDSLAIIECMLAEEDRVMFFSSKRFDTTDPYGLGACSIVIAIIMLAAIVNVKFEEGNDYEH